MTLFADIAGFTRLSESLDPEEATALVNICLDEMTTAVVQQEGRVDKYTGDGLMAVFGVPVAHEDDPERALRAALEMRERVASLELGPGVSPIALHVGLACGQVVAAGVGGRGRREYTVIGLSVNLAARLEEVSAPGQILVSEELARLTDAVFVFLDVPSLSSLPGWGGEVRAFELVEERSKTGRLRHGRELRAPLVGRDVEAALLWRSLENVAAGQGAIISVIGEAGIGKSRLVQEVRARAQEEGLGLTWLEGHPLEHGEPVPYGCFRTLLREAVGAKGEVGVPPDGDRLLTFLQDLMPAQVEEVYPCLGRLLGVSLSPEMEERLEHLDGESLKWQTLQVLRDCISALARGPLLLVFEDLHWVDPVSAELLERLLPLASQTALTIVSVYRPEPERPSWRLREVAGRKYAEVYNELWLHPLSPTAAREMVAHLLGTDPSLRETVDLILDRAEGNPLFIEEIVRSMVDQGVLARQSGEGWRVVEAPKDIIIPDSIQGIFRARIDRLDEEAKRVLQVAACIGREFSRKILAAVAGDVGMSPRLLDRCLAALEKAGLIWREDGAPDGVYAFRHVLIRDTVHSGLLRGSRSQIHRAVARWYEENLRPGSEPPYAVLAYHYEQTDSYEKQRLYFAKAGHEAARGYANREAALFFAKALALTTDPDQRFVLLLARERACDLLGDRTKQRADLDELLQLAIQAGDHRRRAIVYNRFAAWHETQGDYPAARSMANEGLAAARRAGDVQLEAESLLVIAAAHWRQGQFSAALEAGQAALEVSRAVQEAGSEAVGLTLLGIVHRSLGDLRSARLCYQQALDIRQAIGDRRGEAISLSHLANLFYDQGEYTATSTHHQQALDLFRQVGDRRGEAWSLSGLGTFYLTCGDYETARSHYEEALAIRRDIGDRRGEAVALSDLGNLLLTVGELEAARTHLEEAVALTRAIRARRDEVYGLTYLGRVLEKMGSLDGARAAHQVALSRRREQGQEASSVENVAGLGRVALEQGDLEAARVYAAEALAYVREHGLIQIGSPFLVYHTCIRIFEACGEEETARQALEEAYAELMARAERIAVPRLRRSYLERVPEHQEIIAAWREVEEG